MESVNLLVNSNGTVVRSEVVGALKMRTYLSGMPECKLGLNDKVNVCLVIALEAAMAANVATNSGATRMSNALEHCFSAR